MARYKAKWIASLQREPCARCGYTESGNAPAHSHPPVQPANVLTYAGPSAQSTGTIATALTPGSPESSMEEGLLIGGDFGQGYGSIERTEPTIEAPEEVVVGKGKKKMNSSAASKGSGKKFATV